MLPRAQRSLHNLQASNKYKECCFLTTSHADDYYTVKNGENEQKKYSFIATLADYRCFQTDSTPYAPEYSAPSTGKNFLSATVSHWVNEETQ